LKGQVDGKQLARSIRYAVERQALLTSLETSRQQQLQFKDEFLSHVSHEMRTPLTSIYQFTSILWDGLAGAVSAEQRDHLGTILKSVGQLQAMIHDLLEATRTVSGKVRIEPHGMEVAEIMQQAITLLKNSAQQKRISLKLEVDPSLPLAYADGDRVLQILINLIGMPLNLPRREGPSEQKHASWKLILGSFTSPSPIPGAASARKRNPPFLSACIRRLRRRTIAARV